MSKPIRVVSVMEAHTVTGPVKNMIRFASGAREFDGVLPPVELSFATFVRGNRSNDFIDSARQNGIEVDVIPERHAFDPAVSGALAKIVGQRKPDILQTHMIKGHFLVRLSARLRSGQPWLAFHHGYTTEDLKMRVYNQLNRISLPAADKVVTVCRPFADVLTGQGVSLSKIEILPNSIEPAAPASDEQTSQLRRSLGLAPHDRILVSVGRLSSEKGHSDLIPTMTELSHLLPEVSIRHVLVGDGIERNNLQHSIAAAGLADRFIFAGHQRDVRPFYALADIFVLPSHSEGSPNVLLEAMAYGVPIVATSVGGIPDTVRQEHSALLVEPRHPVQIAGSVARLLMDPSLGASLARSAAADVAERFSPAAYRRALISLYENACRKRSEEAHYV